MIFLQKTESFTSLMTRVKDTFNKKDFLNDIFEKCETSMILKSSLDQKFLEATQGLIILAVIKTMDTGKDVEAKEFLESKYQQYMSDISSYLSFTSLEQAQLYLHSTPYISEDLTFCLLQYAFFALVLIDEKVYRRFKDAYTVWQNSIEVDFAGFATLQGEIKAVYTYMTFYGNRIFYIDPLKGEIRAFKREAGLYTKEIKTLKVVCVDGIKKICAECKDKSLVPLVEYDFMGISHIVHATYATGSDMRAAERRRKREKGYEVKETPWQTVQLDKVDGSLHTMKSHILISIVVYGLDAMKFGVMDGQSIFTIDHIDETHDNNTITNLQLLTRKSNDDKKNSYSLWVFDYFTYWTKCIANCYKIEENYNFRAKITN